MMKKEPDEKILDLMEKFSNKFPTNRHCNEFLVNLILKDNLIQCKFCHSNSFQMTNMDKRILRCLSCEKPTWFTKGTLFHRVKKIKVWFAVIWFRAHGVFISSNRMSQLVEAAQSTISSINKRLDMMLMNKLERNTYPIDAELFSDLILKRSRKTPKDMHPRAEYSNSEEDDDEEFENRTNKDDDRELCESESFQKDELEILKILADKNFHFNALCKQMKVDAKNLAILLSMMEINQLVQRLPGELYQSLYKLKFKSKSKNKTDYDGGVSVGSVHNFVKTVYHGVSLKYLQLYLFNFLNFASRIELDDLVKHCLMNKPVSYKQILNFVSSKSVLL